MTKIFYNNKDVFSGISYTPFVSFDQKFDGWWQSDKTFVLNGEIVSCGTGYSQMLDKQANLVKNFSENFKNFSIKQDDNILFSCDYACVEGIKFDESNYTFSVPYSVEIKAHDRDLFSGQYYVTDPVNSFNFIENRDQTVSIKHNVSAKGLVSSVPAIVNAKNWVYSQSGWKNAPLTNFINMNVYNKPILVSISEEINRMDGSYSLNEEYSFDQANTGIGILKYSVNIGYDLFNFSTASIKGNILAGINGSIDSIRDRYKSLDLWSLTFDIYSGCTNLGDLNKIYLSSGVSEDLSNKEISFSVEFNNDNSPLIFVKSNSEYLNSLDGEDDNAKLSATIMCRAGNLQDRLALVDGYFNSKFNAITEFKKNIDTVFYNGPSDLRVQYNLSEFKLVSESIKRNNNDASIAYECEWNIKKENINLPCYIRDLSYSVAKSYSREEYDINTDVTCEEQVAQPKWSTQDSVSFDGEASIEKNSYGSARSYIAAISSQYAMGQLTHQEFTDNSQDGNMSFQIEWQTTAEGI